MGASKKKRGQGGELKVILWAQSLHLQAGDLSSRYRTTLLDSHRTGCCVDSCEVGDTFESNKSTKQNAKREAAQEDNSESNESSPDGYSAAPKMRQRTIKIPRIYLDWAMEERQYFAFCAAIPIDQDEVQGRNCRYRCLARGISFSMFSDLQLQNRMWSVSPMPPAANSKDISAVSEQQ